MGMCWCVKQVSEVKNLGVSCADRQGVKLDFTPDQSETMIFSSRSAATAFAFALYDLFDPLDDYSFVVEPYRC